VIFNAEVDVTDKKGTLKIRLLAVLSVAVLSGCSLEMEFPLPVISDISDSAVKLQVNANLVDEESLHAVARQGCGYFGKQPKALSYKCVESRNTTTCRCTKKEIMSYRPIQYACTEETCSQNSSCVTREYLFACIRPNKNPGT